MQSKSPRRFQTPLSDVTNLLEAKKPIVSQDHSYYSSKIVPLRISPSQDSTVYKVTENLENSLVWFADLCSEFGSIINNITVNSLNNSANSDSLNVSMEATQRLSSCPAINQELNDNSSNASVKDDENVELSKRTENVSTQTNVLECNNVPIDNSAAIIQTLKKDLTEKQKIIKTLQEQNDIIKKSIEKVSKMYSSTKRKYLAHKKEIKRLRENKNNNIIYKRLKTEQIQALNRKTNKGLKWSVATVIDALVFRMKWGTQGYADFVKRLPIYPCIRTLQRNIYYFKFNSGILLEVFDILKSEVPRMITEERECVIVLDEMAIKPGEVFDPSIQRVIGSCTFPAHSGIATKVLVILLAGVVRRWKITVAYYFTGTVDSKCKKQDVNATGNALKEIILTLIEKTENIGLRVTSVISDMGSDNKAMWNAFGVGCTKQNVEVSIVHPIRPTNRLNFIPDPVHLFKNIKIMLESNETICLPTDICAAENLSSPLVEYKHVEELMHHENKYEMKIAYRLKETNLHCKNQYNKMKVSTASSVINRRTESALKIYANNTSNDSYKTTAFFISLVYRWFQIMTNRSCVLALGKRNLEMYNETISHLKKTIQVFRTMSIGQKGHWKPVQFGIIMATESMIELQQYFLDERKHKYLLTGRFTQDCLENLFSLVRFKQPIPNPLLVKQNLKVITITQACMYSKNTSYDNDVEENNFEQVKLDFLKLSKEMMTAREKAKEVDALMEGAAIYVPELQDNDMHLIDLWEWPIIYDIAGAVVHSVQTTMKICDTCYTSVLWQDTDSHPFSIIVNLRSYKEDSLCKVSDSCFKAIMKAEITFRELRDSFVKAEHIQIINFLVEKMLYVWENTNITQCHNITVKILKRFFYMRFRIFNLQRKEFLEKENKNRMYSSKT